MIWKALFGALGLGSLVWILNGFGFARIAHDLANLGWWSIPLALSFLPVAFCYAAAWHLITPNWPLRAFPRMISLSIVSVAWNNLSPFVKMLGEPVRLVLLEKTLPRKEAAQSVVLYNIVHSLGTLLSFFFGALALLLFFPVSAGLRTGFLALLVISPLSAAALFFLPHLLHRLHRRPSKTSRFYLASFWLRWSLHKIRLFAHRYPARFWSAVALEIVARFVEGATFWVAFQAFGQNVPAVVCALLDVGRALLDNVFFFVPYQVGSREGGILLLAQHAVHIPEAQAVSAAVLYRLVEIFWMVVGYLLWMSEGRAASSSR